MWKRDSAAPRRGPVARRGGALRRTSVLRSKTLPQAEFTSAEEDQKGGPRGMGHPVGRSCTRGRWATQSFKKCMRAPMWKRVSAAPRRGPWIRKGVCTFLVPPRKVPKRRRAKGSTPLQSPGSVEGAYDSTPAPEACILWHPSTHCRSTIGYRSLARSTERA